MELSYVGSYEELSREAVRIIVDQVRAKPSLLLCPATGDTPTLTYSLLAEYAKANKNAFSQMRLAGLDEWGGLGDQTLGTCQSYLQSRIIEPLELQDDNVEYFRGGALSGEEECARIKKHLDTSGPIDLCILGIGLNGHLGFNEPDNSLTAESHVARLSETSLKHAMTKNMKFLPPYGMTLGMADIMKSRKIILLISGAHKKLITERLLQSDIRTDLPASFLFLHQAVTCIIDAAASGKISGEN